MLFSNAAWKSHILAFSSFSWWLFLFLITFILILAILLFFLSQKILLFLFHWGKKEAILHLPSSLQKTYFPYLQLCPALHKIHICHICTRAPHTSECILIPTYPCFLFSFLCERYYFSCLPRANLHIRFLIQLWLPVLASYCCCNKWS